MDHQEAAQLYKRSDRHYRAGEYDEALALLDALTEAFPNDKSLLFARARTLAKLRRSAEALIIAERLVEEFGYSNAKRLRKRMRERMSLVDDPVFSDGDASGSSDQDLEGAEEKERRFRVKPIPLLLLIGIVAAMATGYVNYWIGGGLIVGYFVVVWTVKTVLYRLFTLPIKMKGKALAGATATVHSVIDAPEPPEANYDDTDGDALERRYLYIDVTITPEERANGFTHWEPGELLLVPMDTKILKLEDLDAGHQVVDYRMIRGGREEKDEYGKYAGTQRLKLHVGVPRYGELRYRFAYYFETFGDVEIPPPFSPGRR